MLKYMMRSFLILGLLSAASATAQQTTPAPAPTTPPTPTAPVAGGITIPVTSAGVLLQAGAQADLANKAAGAGAKLELDLDDGTQRNWATVNGNIMSDYNFGTGTLSYTGEVKTSAIPFQDMGGSQLLELQPIDLTVSQNAVTAPGYGAAFSGGLLTNTGVHVKTTPSSNQSNYFTVSAKPLSMFSDRNNGMQSYDGLNAVNVRAEHNFGSYIKLKFDGVAGALSWLSNTTATQSGVGYYLSGRLSLRGDIPGINMNIALAALADDVNYKYVTNATALTTQVNDVDVRAMLFLGTKFDIGTRPPATKAATTTTTATPTTVPAQ